MKFFEQDVGDVGNMEDMGNMLDIKDMRMDII